MPCSTISPSDHSTNPQSAGRVPRPLRATEEKTGRPSWYVFTRTGGNKLCTLNKYYIASLHCLPALAFPYRPPRPPPAAHLTMERELWQQAAYDLARTVASECRLSSVQRLQLGEKAWAKLAGHFAILLSNKDTQQVRRMSLCCYCHGDHYANTHTCTHTHIHTCTHTHTHTCTHTYTHTHSCRRYKAMCSSGERKW